MPISETMPPDGYQPVTVSQVDIEVGVVPPIPVHVNVRGSLPDICSQVEHPEIRQEGSVQDTLPFRFREVLFHLTVYLIWHSIFADSGY